MYAERKTKSDEPLRESKTLISQYIWTNIRSTLAYLVCGCVCVLQYVSEFFVVLCLCLSFLTLQRSILASRVSYKMRCLLVSFPCYICYYISIIWSRFNSDLGRRASRKSKSGQDYESNGVYQHVSRKRWRVKINKRAT